MPNAKEYQTPLARPTFHERLKDCVSGSFAANPFYLFALRNTASYEDGEVMVKYHLNRYEVEADIMTEYWLNVDHEGFDKLSCTREEYNMLIILGSKLLGILSE